MWSGRLRPMSTDDLGFGERLREYRRAKGLGQRQFGKSLGRSESWVSQLERGILIVNSLPMLQRMADALGVTLSDLRPDLPGPESGSDRFVLVERWVIDRCKVN